MNPTKNHQEPFAFRIEIEGLRRIAEDLRVHRNGISGILALLALIFLFCPIEMRANVPGGGNGKGSGVTVTDNGETVTMGNGIVSMVIEKSTARLNSVTYTHANSGAPLGSEMLKGKGQFWYGGFPLGGHTFTYSLSTNPASNGGNYGDVMLLNTSENHGIMEVHFSMLRGSQGFYTTATQIHRSQDAACEVGAWGFLCRVPLDFHWVSIDPMRNFSLGEMGTQKGARVPDSAHEVSVLFDGGMQGQFDDKFIYAQNYGDAQAWGWSSVGQGGLNVGIWLMTGMEFGDGGPLKRDVATSHDHGLNNPMLTGEVGMGSDGNFSNGELWTKTCGPCFFYVNSIPGSITDPSKAAHLLYQDALAQHAAEEAAWPYAWFKNANYVPASGRGMVTGRFVIQDSGNPNASASGLWVGLEQQPRTTNGTDDFQKWLKPYQYWMKTDANGNFAIPNVIAGNSYTLWAYGPGAAGTFLSQNQTGGNPPLECDLPEKPFAVNVAAGGTTALGTVTWTPARLGATVFELGYPNRQANKFRHGEDYWVPEIAPKLGYPTPVWGGQMEYPLDYPDGMTYTVGKSRWDRDWNYVLPSSPDASGADQPCTGTIHFTLPRAPAAGAKAAIYLACAGDDGGHIILGVNGGNLGSAMGVSAAPEPVAETGYTPPYEDDSSAHFSDHGPFSDERIAFPGAMLHAGDNTLTIQMGAKSGVAYLMVDYLRLELTGYVPPAPPGVAALREAAGTCSAGWRRREQRVTIFFALVRERVISRLRQIYRVRCLAAVRVSRLIRICPPRWNGVSLRGTVSEPGGNKRLFTGERGSDACPRVGQCETGSSGGPFDHAFRASRGGVKMECDAGE